MERERKDRERKDRERMERERADSVRQPFITRHGVPEILISDNGKEFTAQDFEVYLRDLGIDHHRTTPMHPQSNGRTERFTRTDYMGRSHERVTTNNARLFTRPDHSREEGTIGLCRSRQTLAGGLFLVTLKMNVGLKCG